MTQQETLEFSKRCALFLGLTPTKGLGSKKNQYYKKIDNDRTEMYDNVSFYSDWNWIHEVVEGIKNITNPKEHSDTTFLTLRHEIQSHLGRSNKEAIVQAINQFLIWYNENKTN